MFWPEPPTAWTAWFMKKMPFCFACLASGSNGFGGTPSAFMMNANSCWIMFVMICCALTALPSSLWVTTL
jgi:hypothetical protein